MAGTVDVKHRKPVASSLRVKECSREGCSGRAVTGGKRPLCEKCIKREKRIDRANAWFKKAMNYYR